MDEERDWIVSVPVRGTWTVCVRARTKAEARRKVASNEGHEGDTLIDWSARPSSWRVDPDEPRVRR